MTLFENNILYINDYLFPVPLEEMYAKVDKKRKLAGGPPPPPTSPPPAPTSPPPAPMSPPPAQASTSQPPQPAPRSKMDRMKGLFKKTPKQRGNYICYMVIRKAWGEGTL